MDIVDPTCVVELLLNRLMEKINLVYLFIYVREGGYWSSYVPDVF